MKVYLFKSVWGVFDFQFRLVFIKVFVIISNLEVDECRSKENLFGKCPLLMTATHIVLP